MNVMICNNCVEKYNTRIYKRIDNNFCNKMQLLINKMKLLSSGANSKVYLYGEGEASVVIKMVSSKAVKQSKHLSNQYQILKQLDHQNIISALKFKQGVQLRGFTEEESAQESTAEIGTTNDVGYNFSQQNEQQNILILEHARFGSFLDLIKKAKLKVGQIRQLFYQAAEAIEYLHCKYIVHRDIKLDNILITSQADMLTVKLADFGFARSCLNHQNQNLIQFKEYKGTKRGYMAPEIHEVLKNTGKFYDARKADVFALGVSLFAALFGSLPFEFANMQNRLYKLIAQEKYQQFWKNHSHLLQRLEGREKQMAEDFKKLFEGMVCYDAQRRLNIEDVLESEWIYGERIKTRAPQY